MSNEIMVDQCCFGLWWIMPILPASWSLDLYSFRSGSRGQHSYYHSGIVYACAVTEPPRWLMLTRWPATPGSWCYDAGCAPTSPCTHAQTTVLRSIQRRRHHWHRCTAWCRSSWSSLGRVSMTRRSTVAGSSLNFTLWCRCWIRFERSIILRTNERPDFTARLTNINFPMSDSNSRLVHERLLRNERNSDIISCTRWLDILTSRLMVSMIRPRNSISVDGGTTLVGFTANPM